MMEALTYSQCMVPERSLPMSLHPQASYPIPEETARVAQALCPTGHPFLRLREEFGLLFTDQDFADLFPVRGQPAASPSRLFLITILQFMEGLTDRQAADAVRWRLDWKYILGLELTDLGFHFSVLSEFRTRLLSQKRAHDYLDRFLSVCQERGWLKAHGRQRTDSTHILGAIRSLNRLECVGETMRHALDTLARVAPEWLYSWLPPEWLERYRTRVSDFRLPKGAAERKTCAEQMGRDGVHLLLALEAPGAPAWLREVPALVALRQIWEQQFHLQDGLPRWRPDEAMPCATELIQSPHDVEARYSNKRSVEWLGYKVHLTETCDEETPHLIVHVETTPAPLHDTQVVSPIHADLAAQKRLPAEHLVDGGYVEADQLIASQQDYGVDLVGPMQIDHSWQAKAGEGFDSARFRVDWATHTVHCPQGQTSSIWKTARSERGAGVIHVAFHHQTCLACPVRSKCTHSKSSGRELTLRPQALQEAIVAARQRQGTAAFRQRYSKRSGIEGTIAQGTRTCALRRSRYRGLAKTHLQHTLTAISMNVLRILAWLAEKPRAQVRPSLFARLAPTA